MVDAEKFGSLTFSEYLSLLRAVLEFPFILTYRLLVPFPRQTTNTPRKSVRRIIGDTVFRFLCDRLSYRQLQRVNGTTLSTYKRWTRSHRLTYAVSEIGEADGQLMWIGPRCTERVFLYFHGGGFVCSIQDYMLSFLRAVQLNLENRGIQIGVVVLAYSIIPAGGFPDPLRQATLAVQHLLSLGVEPRNIQLGGDSAGGNLILQLFSHILHPHPDVPRLDLTPDSRFASAVLISPWVSLLGDGVQSFDTRDQADILSAKVLREWGRRVLRDVPDSGLAYIVPCKAPPGWFVGLGHLVDRVLVMAGDQECLVDAIVEFEQEHISRYIGAGRAKLWVQPGGVHEDPLMDFFVRSGDHSKGTKIVNDWLAESEVASVR